MRTGTKGTFCMQYMCMYCITSSVKVGDFIVAIVIIIVVIVCFAEAHILHTNRQADRQHHERLLICASDVQYFAIPSSHSCSEVTLST